jgi:hypothetical protein
MNAFASREDRVAARKVGGEMVILSADDSSLFVLNDVGTAIWEAADGRTSLQAIARGLCSEYDVDEATALRDVEDFVAALAEAGVLSTSDRAVS